MTKAFIIVQTAWQKLITERSYNVMIMDLNSIYQITVGTAGIGWKMIVNDFCNYISDESVSICLVDNYENRWLGVFPKNSIPGDYGEYEVKSFFPKRCNDDIYSGDVIMVVFANR